MIAFKVSNKVTRTTPFQLTFIFSKSTTETLEKGEIYSKLTVKTPERRH